MMNKIFTQTTMSDDWMKIFKDNPDTPVLYHISEDSDDMVGTQCNIYVGEFLNVEIDEATEEIYLDREDLEEQLLDYYDDEEIVSSKMKEYEQYWQKAIIIRI